MTGYDMSFCVDDVRTWRQFVFLYSSLIPGYIEHILQAWLVASKLFQKHEVAFSDVWRSRLVDVVFAYIKLPKIYFWADRIRREVQVIWYEEWIFIAGFAYDFYFCE